MPRKVRILRAVASMLIAIYAGGWGALAGAWQPAPTEFSADFPDETPRLPGNVFPHGDAIRRLEPAEVFSAGRQVLRPVMPATHWREPRPHERGPVLLASEEVEPQQLDSESTIVFWSDDVDALVGNKSSPSTTASGPRPLLSAPAATDVLRLPPFSTETAIPLEDMNPATSDVDDLGISEWVQEFPLNDFELPCRSRFASRAGWWSVDHNGNPAKVGEYQSLDSSPFFDIDGLVTNGLETLDFSASVLDNDASKSSGRYFGPLLSARWDYERYLRRLDRDPLPAFVDFDRQPPLPLPAPPANFRDMKEDTAAGEDFAIRVQQLNANFKGKLTQNVDWRLNFWGMRKHGERQATAMAHCFTASNATDTNGNPVTGAACHVMSQRQRIDWLTAEIEPVLEGRFGPVTAEYSRTMRALTTRDQLVTRPYDNFGLAGDLPYDVVPENFTQVDRLKIGIALPDRRDAYARIYNGNTQNHFRDTNRRFHGVDLRISDRSVDGVTVTTYAKTYVQTGQFPTVLLPSENAASIRFPINYDRTTAGGEASWRPFYAESSLRRHLRLSCGYEYRELERENAVFVGDAQSVDQSATITNKIHLRAGMRWSPAWNSYVRYRATFIHDPLFAIADNDTTNTSLPTQTHRFEVSNTWSPTRCFLLSGLLGFHNGWNSSSVANYQADNYDLVFSAWFAPTPRWSFSGGLAFYSNWIDQDITLGPSTTPLNLPWEYGGRSDVVNLGTTFAWTKRVTLSGTLDFVNGKNSFDPLVPWPDLPFYSDVEVRTTRFMAGVDYDLGPRATCYFRYQVFDYNDTSPFYDNGIATQIARGVLRPGHDSGRAEMLLFGGTFFF